MKQINTFGNAAVAALPAHLLRYVVDQNYERYTWIDQAVWRYVMRQNYNYLKEIAYYPYIRGLHQAGLSIERIPDLQTINDHLGKIGWGAVTVDGFIPPSAFMEYQAHRVLVIAADIRRLEHIEYTPAPDIIHESAGHAPIIAEPEYHAYLSYFGSIGAKAMFSAKDFELYESIREVSILKESEDKEALKAAEEKLQYISENMGEPSEMALLSRLHWWTVEYGLIGTLEDPKIYGAGLLSSIGESKSCMRPEVKKLPYTIDAINYAYDITKPQPQLFVTPHFNRLLEVLEEFASTMAFRRGGAESLKKAVDCGQVCTVSLDSGVEISGKFISYSGDVDFIKTEGPTALAYGGRQLPGHDKTLHQEGYSSPIGEYFIQKGSLSVGEDVLLQYASGYTVEGRVTETLFQEGRLIVATLMECTVRTPTAEICYRPEWGRFDLVLGIKVISVYSGAADKSAYETDVYLSEQSTKKEEYSSKLHEIYGGIRQIREGGSDISPLKDYFAILQNEFPEDWLASLEILELWPDPAVEAHLNQLKERFPEYRQVIEDGLRLHYEHSSYRSK
jgi:phenylalanine-4-hydroxylase